MWLNIPSLKASGFDDDEIRQIQEYCDAADKAGRFNPVIALVQPSGKPSFCCTTIAEVFDRLRPGSWLNRPGGDHYREATALMRRLRKKMQRRM